MYVNVSKFRNLFTTYLERVQNGEDIAITKYGVTKAYLISVEEYSELLDSQHTLDMLTGKYDEFMEHEDD